MKSQTTTIMDPQMPVDIHLMAPLMQVVPLAILGVMETSSHIPPSVLQIEGDMVVPQVWEHLLGQSTWSGCAVSRTLPKNKTLLSFSSHWCVAE